ncbi:N-acetylmannosamine-6-phosphate 2-epimerase [Bhargavaea beijingensis]|uniref:Putative N-acetylmannosamine-6-phosphate 2-epimerase n=1 Tax=Bhargavaea beijingensis TaxID=426756 RepID=A0A1G7A1A6_9BACL|nr:N-acetylmannosamine-6-phosphate 2-epimerase [Bhargavaea beijingensis]MCW1927247.1 N-acetylmannosamine-6-phosphate 2-epimerase [Bhargavaea beijingensis]RSK35619.1 N-acetylmannosamine-6-phosphate 2-epimerase [Bhargavaea beijingensis]SDE08413.1 N-acylglucosamine-6-phosphate 2-epimerase [Bhargavaea beijingensis]
MDSLEMLKGRLIVSCQALEDEPLHDPYIMGKMALAAKIGGAAGIRANTVKDIRAIKKEVDLPIIGIVKKNYGDHPVFITPTFKEVSELVEEGVDVIAFDATGRKRPDGKTFADFFGEVKASFPDQLFMADCSSADEAVEAERAGVDIVATTLVGYTPYTEGHLPLDALEETVSRVSVPVIAEGNIDTPDKAREALRIGAHAVVVGGAITRPQLITKKFADAMDGQA